MKCAMELMVTAATRAEENASAWAAERAKEAVERRKNTIKYCEEIGDYLERMANNGKKPTKTFLCGGYLHYRVLGGTHSHYKDGRLSYYAISEEIDLDVMAEWFAPYCFIVKRKECRYWSYGSGEVTGCQVTIEPQPECIS